MNIVFIKHFCVGCMVSEITRVSVFGHCPYSVTFPYRLKCHYIFKKYQYHIGVGYLPKFSGRIIEDHNIYITYYNMNVF